MAPNTESIPGTLQTEIRPLHVISPYSASVATLAKNLPLNHDEISRCYYALISENGSLVRSLSHR